LRDQFVRLVSYKYGKIHISFQQISFTKTQQDIHLLNCDLI